MIRVTPVRWVTVGALLTVAGLTTAATAPIAGTDGSERTRTQQSAGGVVLVVGWSVLAWGIHRLGREGR